MKQLNKIATKRNSNFCYGTESNSRPKGFAPHVLASAPRPLESILTLASDKAATNAIKLPMSCIEEKLPLKQLFNLRVGYEKELETMTEGSLARIYRQIYL